MQGIEKSKSRNLKGDNYFLYRSRARLTDAILRVGLKRFVIRAMAQSDRMRVTKANVPGQGVGEGIQEMEGLMSFVGGRCGIDGLLLSRTRTRGGTES